MKQSNEQNKNKVPVEIRQGGDKEIPDKAPLTPSKETPPISNKNNRRGIA